MIFLLGTLRYNSIITSSMCIPIDFPRFSLFQIKNDVEAEVLCMTAIGNIKLQQSNMEDTKV